MAPCLSWITVIVLLCKIVTVATALMAAHSVDTSKEDEMDFLGDTSPAVSEHFAALNEPSFSSKMAKQPVSMAQQQFDVIADHENNHKLLHDERNDSQEESIWQQHSPPEISAPDERSVDEPRPEERLDILSNHSPAEEVDNIEKWKRTGRRIGSASHSASTATEPVSIPKADDTNVLLLPSFLYTTDGEEEFEPETNDDLSREEISPISNGEFDDDDDDDRSLLDVFGEAAKEYLTQRVIPPTDADCRWDWRSFRCESSCRCHFQWKRFDYHLGRACRRRGQDLVLCPPTIYVMDRPIPKRLVSLLQQTADILHAKIKRLVDNIARRIKHRYAIVQNRICSDLWSYLYEAVDGSQCWLWIPTSTTILERVFCGRNMHRIPPCREDLLSSLQQNRLPGTAAQNIDRRFRHRRLYPPPPQDQVRTTGGLYENEVY